MPGCPIPQFKINRYQYNCLQNNTTSGNEKLQKIYSTLNSSAMNEDAFLYSALLKSSGRKLTCKSVMFENKQTNAFKRWDGAPGGGGARITNVF